MNHVRIEKIANYSMKIPGTEMARHQFRVRLFSLWKACIIAD